MFYVVPIFAIIAPILPFSVLTEKLFQFIYIRKDTQYVKQKKREIFDKRLINFPVNFYIGNLNGTYIILLFSILFFYIKIYTKLQ